MTKVRLRSYYENQVVPSLQEEFKYKTLLEVPKIEKIVINRGLGEASDNSKLLDSCYQELTTLSGQRAIITRAKKSIAGFKLRKNAPVGVCVTLRGDRMFAFLDRLINLALPRIRDFQGVNPQSFDGLGNFHLGLRDQLMFPEISYDSVGQLRGMDINIVTTAKSNIEGFYLLNALGMPFWSIS